MFYMTPCLHSTRGMGFLHQLYKYIVLFNASVFWHATGQWLYQVVPPVATWHHSRKFASYQAGSMSNFITTSLLVYDWQVGQVWQVWPFPFFKLKTANVSFHQTQTTITNKSKYLSNGSIWGVSLYRHQIMASQHCIM